MNQKMMELLDGNVDKYPKFIEANYPHILDKLVECWGTSQMLSYLDELMMSKRPDRVGFPPEAAAEIWAISSLYSKMRPPVQESVPTDVWREDIETAHTDWKESSFSKK